MSELNDSSANLPDDMAEYLQTFLDETDEQLDDLVETLLVLEQDAGKQDELNGAFRLIHSIKGSAGMMGFANIADLAHQLENRFEAFRSGSATLDEPTMNVVLRCVDFLRDSNDRLRSGKQVARAAELIRQLNGLDNGEAVVAEPPPPAPGPAGPTAGVETVRIVVRFRGGLQLADLKAQLILRRLAKCGDVTRTSPEATEVTDSSEPTDFEIEIATEEDEARLRDVVSVDGVESVAFPSRAPADEDTEAAEEIKADETVDDAEAVEDIHDVEAAEAVEAIEAADSAESAVADQAVEAVDPTVTTADLSSTNFEESTEMLAKVASAVATPSTLAPESKGSGERQADDKAAAKVGQSMRVDIERLDNLMNLAGELVINRARFVQVAGLISPALRKAGAVNQLRDFSEALRRTVDALQSGEAFEKRSAHLQQLRSGLELVDEQIDVLEHSRRCLGQFDKAIDQLSRVANNLQRGVLDTRMLPVGPLFNRFRRVVRDLSKDHGKQVELRIHGEKTELDKRMIDDVFDPLMHLVRNAVDHGLEPTEERVQRGKPATGVISLDAMHSGNNVYIRVQDDGRGIDAEKIRGKLVDKGLLSAADAKELSDEQALQHIWRPGFSTSAAVTDVSGRGVGMDVVKTRINQLNGSIDVASTPQRGTTFTLRLPLTLAIINSLLVRRQETTFSMPLDDVREIVVVDEADVLQVAGKQAFEIRGELIPLVRIRDVFHWHGVDYDRASSAPGDSPTNGGPTQVVILQAAGRAIGLQVDELLGSQDVVVKSLSDNFVDIRGLSGASILGDGSVCLMMDVGALIDIAAKSPSTPGLEESRS